MGSYFPQGGASKCRPRGPRPGAEGRKKAGRLQSFCRSARGGARLARSLPHWVPRSRGLHEDIAPAPQRPAVLRPRRSEAAVRPRPLPSPCEVKSAVQYDRLVKRIPPQNRKTERKDPPVGFREQSVNRHSLNKDYGLASPATASKLVTPISCAPVASATPACRRKSDTDPVKLPGPTVTAIRSIWRPALARPRSCTRRSWETAFPLGRALPHHFVFPRVSSRRDRRPRKQPRPATFKARTS